MVGLAQIRYLTLERNVHRTNVLYKLERGYFLHLNLGVSIGGNVVSVYCSHPTSAETNPKRNVFHKVALKRDGENYHDDTDLYAEVAVRHPGPHRFCFFLGDRTEQTLVLQDLRATDGSGYFIVSPVLRHGSQDDAQALRPDALSSQTYISKLLGPLSSWEKTLAVAKASGYNVIHLTPVQQLGVSHSAYAIGDHFQINPEFGPGVGYKEIAALTKKIWDEWGILVIQDAVLNHTGIKTKWLRENPQCSYNLVNSPHLKPAYVLDRIIYHLSHEIASGQISTIPSSTLKIHDLQEIERILDERVTEANLEEFFLIPVDSTLASFSSMLKTAISKTPRCVGQNVGSELIIKKDTLGGRFGNMVELDPLMPYFIWRIESGASVADCIFQIKQMLTRHNERRSKAMRDHLRVALKNVSDNVTYRFLNPQGKRYPKVSETHPLMLGYFYHGNLPPLESALEEEKCYANEISKGELIWAHNGWVFEGDALVNFAESGHVYLRRELVPWGDNIKLNYGRNYEDNPVLWKTMCEYVVQVAKAFHGIRLDNCHSTPLHVAEYMLAAAREVNPHLYVIAELFTPTAESENVFINRLGINALVREANNAKIPRDLGAMIHLNSAKPVGAFYQLRTKQLQSSVPSSIIYDQTHDNPSVAETRSLMDFLPTAAIVAMSDGAIGSNRGYDELVQHHIDVVKETRRYKPLSDDNDDESPDSVTEETGIIKAKRFLNQLHAEMARTGFDEIYVDQISDDVVAVTRHNHRSHQSIVLVAYSAFKLPAEKKFFQPMRLAGLNLDQVLFEASLQISPAKPASADGSFIEPAPGCNLYFKSYFPVYESNLVEVHQDEAPNARYTHGGGSGLEIDFVNFKPGDVIAFKFSLDLETKSHILDLRSCLSLFGYAVRTCSGRSLTSAKENNLESILSTMSLADLNFALFRCAEEERVAGCGGTYNLPGYGDLVFAGLQGFIDVLDSTRPTNDLGHPLFANLREGDWMLDYISKRLINQYGTKKLGLWFQQVFVALRKIPGHLVPCYFDAIMCGIHDTIMDEIWSRMGDFVSKGSPFVKKVALASVQLVASGVIYKMPFVPEQSGIPTIVDADSGQRVQAIPSMAAGLPHFAAGIFRSWGRDTFISLRGLLLIPRRFDEAKWIILSYGSALRHGLIPNLLGEGIGARYNCRDAVWWWLQSVKDYCLETDSVDILQDVVHRLYPTDDSPLQSFINTPVLQPLHDLIHEALDRHWNGISFREQNAGPAIDSHMKDEGFNVGISVDRRTGFVTGGNSFNCGTWMDKMGNDGKPATPRDGAAVEIVALSFSVMKWLSSLPERVFPRQKVGDDDDDSILLADWAKRIEDNFESHFWIPSNPADHGRSGFYKDTLGASFERGDCQLRPNFSIALVVAPDLFDPIHAHLSLALTRDVLMGPLGVKTLDPEDPDYDGLYLDGSDNYHQGPEWLYPAGFFLRALLTFSTVGSLPANLRFVKVVIGRYHSTLEGSAWNGLPELTNAGGTFCPGSCRAQAWSHATVLELLHHLSKMGQ